jgi:putative exporter of polyketide antibiotics
MSYVVVFAVITVIFLCVTVELVAAALPILIVITMVPPEQRGGLAELLAAADSSRRLRLWTALRVAVKARRLSGRSPGSPR